MEKILQIPEKISFYYNTNFSNNYRSDNKELLSNDIICFHKIYYLYARNFNKKLYMSLKRFGVSLEDNLLESLDQYVNENGFANRSQAIRFLVEKNVAEKKWQCNHIVAGTIILMYDQVKKEIASRIADIQQNYQDVILSSSQYYVNRNFCLHIATVMGTAYRLTELSDRLTTIKGLKHGKLVMSRAD